MTCRFLTFLSLAALVAGAHGAAVNAQESQVAIRFRREAPPKWEEYVGFARGLRMTRHTVTSEAANPLNVGRESHSEYKQMPGHMLYSREEVKPKPDGWCLARNERYAFELKKGKGGWILIDLDTNPADGQGGAAVKAHLTPDLVQAYCPFQVRGEWLPDLIKKPGFRIEKAHILSGESAGRLRIDFRFAFDGQKNQDIFFDAGWLVLDPEQYWRLCEYEVNVTYRVGDRSVVHETIQCGKGETGHPLLALLIRRERVAPSDGPGFENVTTTTVTVSEKTPSPADFTLSAFGLPEPREFTPPPNPPRYYLWIAGMAGILVAAAFLFRRLARRAEAAKA